MSERRYSEEEFARILRKATELQARRLPAPSGGGAGEAESATPEAGKGLSLPEIQAIAREVGIPPELVEEAARLSARATPAARQGTKQRFLLRRSVPGVLPAEAQIRVIQAIRDATVQQGDVETLPTGVEWSSANAELRQIQVSVHSVEGNTEIRVAVDRSAEGILTHLFPTVGGWISGMATGAVLEPGFLVGAGIVLGGLGLGLGVARGIWSRNSRTSEGQAREILDRVSETVAGVVKNPGQLPG